jgi:hypothetical protein
MNHFIAGTASAEAQTHRHATLSTCRYTIHLPGLLQGSRCYTDASTGPDQASWIHKKAGLGIFIINNQVHTPQNIYIKAAMLN